MTIINFIAQQWDSILLILVFVAIVVYSIVHGNKGIVMKMLYAAVTEAEREFGAGTGSLKLATVIADVYPKIPAVLKVFVTQAMLTKWVDEALDTAKKAWAKNQNLAAYVM